MANTNTEAAVWAAKGAEEPEQLDSRLPSGDATQKDMVAPAFPLSPSVSYSWNIC